MPTNKEILDLMEVAIEKGNMSAAMELRDMYEARKATTPEPAPTQTEFTPEEIESAGFGGLAQTMRGFQQLEEPAGMLEKMGRSAAAEVVGVPAGIASTLESVMEAADVDLLGSVLGTGGFGELGRAPIRSASKALAETEQEVRGEPSLRGDGVDAWDAFLSGVSEGDYRKVSEGAAWMAEAGASTVPQVITAVASLPLSILTRVGDHAKARAAYRGDDDITVMDIGLGLGASGFGAVADKFLGGIGRGAGSKAAKVAKGLATEGASGAGESVLEQIGTREGEGLFLGVDPTTVARAAVTEATAAGLPAAAISAARRRAPPQEPYVPWVETDENAYDSDARMERLLSRAPEQVIAEEVVAEPAGPAFDPETSLEEYRRALDGRDPDPAEDIRTIEAILQQPGAGPWLGNMQDMALGRLEGDPLSERFRYGAKRADELWEQRMALREQRQAAAWAEEVAGEVTEEAVAEEVVAEEPTSGSDTKEQAAKAAGLVKGRGRWYPANADGTPDTSQAVVHPVNIDGDWHMITSTGMGGGLGTVFHEYKPGLVDPLREGVPFEYSKKDLERRITDAKATPEPEVTPTEEVAETVLEVVPGAEPGAKRTLVPRRTPREQVEADTDVAVRRVEADKALAEEVAAVPTRPRTGEVEPRTTQAQAQAKLDQADVDVDTAASDPSASLADIVEKQARTAGLHSDANNASNEDTRAFLEEMFPDDPGRVKKTMSQDRVPVSQALAELQARDLHTRTPDDFTVKTTDPFDAMLDDIIATGRDADYVEKLAFGHAKIQHRRVYRNLLQEYDKAETQAERNNLSERISNVRDASDRIATANAKANRAWGLAGRYTQFFLDKDLTIVEALAKAKVDKGGLELSKSQRDFIKREYAASDKLEARAKPIRQAAIKKMRALSRVIRRLEGKASPTKRDARLLKEAKRRYDRAEGVVVIADHDIRAAKSIRLNAVDKSQAGVILSPTASNAVQDVFDASRALRSSGEDSALGRQGMNLLARSLFTKEQAWIKTIPPALKMLASAAVNNPAGRARAKRLQQELVDQPYQAVFDLAGGEVADVEGVGGRHGGTLDAKQEEFATNLFNRLGGFGRAIGERLIEPSQNAYALTLNMLRRDYFDRALKKRLAEVDIPLDLGATELVKAVKADPQLLADLESDAYMTNVFTGRGDWRIGAKGDARGKGAKDIAGVLARRLLYAPRYMTSIIENALRTIPSAALTGLLTRRSWTKPLNYKNYPEWFKKLKDREYDPKVLPLVMSGVGPFKDVSDYQRGRLMSEAIFETAWLGSLAALAMIGFGDDEDEVSWEERLRRFNDPESADYRKLVIGNWHISLEGGRGATIRHLMPYGLSRSEADDMATMDFDVDYSRRLGRMLRNKLHPFVSPLVGVLSNEDYLGEPLTDQTYEEAKDNAHDMLVHMGQRSVPVALAFAPIIAESMGEAIGEGMAETGIPGVVPPDPSMADPDAPSLLNRLLVTGGTNMFGIGAQYYDPEGRDAKMPPELRRLLRGSDPTRLLRPPAGL